MHGYEDLALLLLENGFTATHPQRLPEGDVFPLYFAIKSHSLQVVDELLRLGADSFVIRNKVPAVTFCILEGTEAILKSLLYHQCPDIEDISEAVKLYNAFEKNEFGWPALHFALYMNDKSTFESLLQYGSDPNFTGTCPFSTYQLALKNPDPLYAEILRAHGINTQHALIDAILAHNVTEIHAICLTKNWSAEAHGTSLRVATNENMPEIVEFLLQNGVRECAPPAPSAAGYAIDKPEIMRLLLAYDAYPRVLPNAPDAGKLVYGYLCNAVNQHQHETCQVLLEKNVRLSELWTRYVVFNGLEYITLFHDYQALFDSSLNFAIEYNKPEALTFLLNAGYSPSKSIFTDCIRYDTLDCFKVLCTHSGITEEGKNACLKMAISYKNEPFVEYLTNEEL